MLRRSLVALTAAALTVGSFTGPAHAAGATAYTWVGSSQNPAADNHSWTDPRNWNPNGVPGDGDSVLIQQPDASHCAANVDNVPAVSLADLSLQQAPDLCGTSLHGGAITVTGTFAWDGGVLDAPLTLAADSSGTISATHGIRNTVDQDIEVDGTLALTDLSGSAGLFLADDAPLSVTVAPGGVLRSSGSTEIGALSCCTVPASVVNHGTLEVSSGRLHAHDIRIEQDAVVTAAAGAVLDSDAGVVAANGGAHYSGSGRWTIENGAQARMLGTQNVGARFHLELGTVGAASGATLGGRFALRGTGTFDWSAGTVGGAITVARTAHLHVSGVTVGNGRRTLAATDPTSGASAASSLTNHGSVLVDDGAAVTMAGATTITNASDGSLQLAAGTVINASSCCLSPAVLANAGGAVTVGADASGAPAVLTGVAYHDTSGTTTVAAGATLQLPHGPTAALLGSTLTGGGTVQFAGATAVSGHVALADDTTLLLVPGGSFDGSATIDGGGYVQWTGGSMSGEIVLAPEGGTDVGGSAVKSITTTADGTASTITARTAVAFAAGTSAAHDVLDLGSSSLVLAGASTVPAFTEFHSGNLTNTGSMTVSAGSDHADRTGPTATTVNTGTLTLAAGTFAIVNTYEQDRGTLAITATKAGNSRLTVAHAASVAGTVRVVNKAYPPKVGDTLTVLTSSALAWTGAVTSAGTGTSGGHWVAVPGATALGVQWTAA